MMYRMIINTTATTDTNTVSPADLFSAASSFCAGPSLRISITSIFLLLMLISSIWFILTTFFPIGCTWITAAAFHAAVSVSAVAAIFHAQITSLPIRSFSDSEILSTLKISLSSPSRISSGIPNLW